MPNRDDHIDDLFRAAAENYRLKEGDSQWDRINTALSGKPAITEGVQPRRAQKANRWLLLLPLLVVGGGMYLFMNRKPTTVTYISIQAQVAYPQKEKATSTSAKTEANTPLLNVNNNDLTKTSSAPQHQEYSKTLSTSMRTVTPHSIDPIPLVNSSNRKANNARREATNNITTAPASEASALHFDRSSKRTLFHDKVTRLLGAPPSQLSYSGARPGSNLFPRTATLQRTHLDTSRQLHIINTHHKKGIYIGLIIGPEFNQVKSQGPRKLGFDAGVIAGYRFSRRLAIESGVLFAKKFYYSDGKYFKMPGMSVISLEGCTSIFEVPLKLQYSVISKPTTSVFTAAGINSYLMTDEKNDYLLMINGARQSMTGAYKDASRYFAAAVDLSVGYEKKIGKQTAIRMEPYLQIPLKGIGVGTMPIMSTGIHAGISRSF